MGREFPSFQCGRLYYFDDALCSSPENVLSQNCVAGIPIHSDAIFHGCYASRLSMYQFL